MQTPEKLNVVSLEPTEAFDRLTDREKFYAYYMSQATWRGAPIVTKQVSPESHNIIMSIVRLFSDQSVEEVRTELTSSFSAEDSTSFMNYIAYVLGNMGNYTSFGDTKFVPRVSQETFSKMCKSLGVEVPVGTLYDLSTKRLDYYPDGVTCYTSPNMTEEEVKMVNQVMIDHDMEHWNTRVSKEGGVYTVHVASVEKKTEKLTDDVVVQYGDYCDELERLVESLQYAIRYTANENQTKMLEHYIYHFQGGSLDEHKQSQIYWVGDKGPAVETNLGFIENYRDPSGVRAEFESFVSIVDKETSRKFGRLVERAPMFIERLPWPTTMEHDVFHSPDFTSLEVVSFATSGVPAGINIPNYHQIKEKHGFKNVSLGNVIRGTYGSKEPIQYLSPEDDALFKKHAVHAFEIGVGSHELIGHGTGKLLVDGEFDKSITNPLTGQPVTSWYKKGENYSTKFGFLSSAYEECRAESVALLLSTMDEIYDIFETGDQDDLMYVAWLQMVRGGLASCFAYDEDHKRWTQAHSQARWVIYRVLEEVPGLVDIKMGKNDFVVSMNRDLIKGPGLDAMKQFLLKLQVYKSTGDVSPAKAMFDQYSRIDEEIHRIVVENRKPRAITVQPSLQFGQDGSVQMKTYPATVDGMIQSMADKLV